MPDTKTTESPVLYRAFLTESLTSLYVEPPKYPDWIHLDHWLNAVASLLSELRKHERCEGQTWAWAVLMAEALSESTKRPLDMAYELITARVR